MGKKIKVLNLYCGVGGNRKLITNVEVTAVEINPEIAAVYQDLFPDDKVIVGDAHQYLLEHYKEFDFIWTSPPCPSHSNVNNFLHAQGVIRYPAMELWQEIIFLEHFATKKGIKYVVENVQSYYEPIRKPFIAGRHYFWSNFHISNKKIDCDFNTTNMRDTTRKSTKENLELLQKFHGIDLSKFKIKNKADLLRNCVKPELGLHVFNCAFKTKQLKLE